MTTTVDIVGPTDLARAELRLDFARSSVDWTILAAGAALKGDLSRARTLNRVAEIAGAVSRGGEPCVD